MRCPEYEPAQSSYMCCECNERINIGDEYVNLISPYGHWKDTAIKIEGSAVDNLLALFFQLFDYPLFQSGNI